ncbi:protein Wnt-4-like [Daphnia pulex]|uniref:protein Wnt-4-like n=1 Tax=Daphnia pulex TaxID=6669 RepID=UPI001EDD4EC2|nr:protein Wnt-4-like [Daphnia pulex]XP_046458174.1 protein Wnt-4-like [Daphnia pulex]
MRSPSFTSSNLVWSANSVRSTKMVRKSAGTAAGARWSLALLTMVIVHVQVTAASWWLLGTPSVYQSTLELTPTSYKDHCKRLYYLVEKQRELCGLSQNVLSTISLGAKMGISECQSQFRSQRWNCSTFDESTTVFGGVLSIRSRERAYVYAISSAGAAYAVTRACSRGEITECGCDGKIRQKPSKGFEWGGCSEDITFGERFSKEFVDAREDNQQAEGLMNLHNNEAGRRAIRSRMELVCKCHGVSGSCSMKVCWRKMAAFSEIGAALMERFEGAFQMTYRGGGMATTSQAGISPSVGSVGVAKKLKKKLLVVDKNMKKPTKKDLVYLDDSPDYCERNQTLGVLGTKSRICNKTSKAIDGCSLLCCGRGYQTRWIDLEEKCNCRFVWCCHVQCEICKQRKELHLCN